MHNEWYVDVMTPLQLLCLSVGRIFYARRARRMIERHQMQSCDHAIWLVPLYWGRHNAASKIVSLEAKGNE